MSQNEHLLDGVRVIEIGDEISAYAGKLLAGLGADVIKIEPPEGCPTRNIGPFYQDEPGPERSLFWWHYSIGKRSLTLDLESQDGRATLLRILATSDLFLDARPKTDVDRHGPDEASIRAAKPEIVIARMSPFGDSGPWADYRGSDLVHLALGGPMMNCGYDPQPDGTYDTPPIAPQMWQAYHIAGELTVMNAIAALIDRGRSGRAQTLHTAVHDAVAKNTELDLMSWVYRRARFYRQTCRHAMEEVSPLPMIGPTKDGRWVMALPRGRSQSLIDFLDSYGMAADLNDVPAESGGANTRSRGETAAHLQEVSQRLIRKFRFEDVPWRDAQDLGHLWAPLRKPHENALDPHWWERGSFARVEHPEHESEFVYTSSKWVSSETAWKVGPRAPLLGEHNEEIIEELRPSSPEGVSRSDAGAPLSPRVEHGAGSYAAAPSEAELSLSRWGTPFPLEGVRILDFTWWLASGGAPRFLSALGAEDIKVEWHQNMDLRVGMAQFPQGGKAARQALGVNDAPLPPDNSTINRSGQFNDFHAGHRGLSLNLRDPRGLEIAKQLVAVSDIVAEGFSPGVMERWGLGYEVMKEIKPDIIYLSQSGMGQVGVYGRYRTVGPIAASFGAVSELSGLPEPYAPAGWGYSYLDWFGAYNLANAMMAALYYRDRTGKGQWIDSSQVDAGIYLNGTSVLEWSANGTIWQRYGNRSPYKPAAPHGAYQCRDDIESSDRWIAFACFDDSDWQSLCRVMGDPEWTATDHFATLADRLANQDELDERITEWTRQHDRWELMTRLQEVGIAAGVCQDAQDRLEVDPQLAHLNWLTEVEHTEMGPWPTKEVPVKWSHTPPFMGGPIDRGAPCYGEDNHYVLGELLGMSSSEITRLAEDGVIAEDLVRV
ncbi:MAG: CoA transferase [Chloroflexi bacterium]|nr:CoA transferase [Chloroflexota bacterium]